MSIVDGVVGLAAYAEIDSELCPRMSFRVLMDNIPIRFRFAIFGVCIAEEQLATAFCRLSSTLSRGRVAQLS